MLLHERGLLPGFLDALAPTAKRLSEPVVPKDHAGKFVRYSELSSLTDERERLVQHELVEWARRFRLTENLSTHGACLPWALRFGRGFCEGSPRFWNGHGGYGRLVIATPNANDRPAAQTAPEAPMPLRLMTVGWPNHKERFHAWAQRIRPFLRAWYRDANRRQRISVPDQNPDRYKWFALMLLGNLSAEKAVVELSRLKPSDMYRPDITSYALRKAVPRVCQELGVSWKDLNENRVKLQL